MKFKFNKFLFILFFNFNIISFDSIYQLEDYIKNYPEFPTFDGQIESGNFSSFYKSLKLNYNFFNTILFNLGIKKDIRFNYHNFENILKDIINKNQNKYNLKSYAYLLELEPKSKIILWGDIQSGLHTLYRDLNYLFKNKIIDQNFKIIDSNNYFVFNGNLIGLGPYPIEVLSVIIKLINTNPNNVFYIKGLEEDIHIWPKHSLKKQISIFPNITTREINLFFDTLPMALFIKIKNKEDLLAISYFGPPEYNYLENIKKIIKNNSYYGPEIINLNSIKTYIKGNEIVYKINENILKAPQAIDFSYGYGLYRLDNIADKVAWTTESCPIQLYHMKYNFSYDSFVLLDFALDIENSIITNYFNDKNTINNKNNFDKFKLAAKYNLTSGEILQYGKISSNKLISKKNDFELTSNKNILEIIKFIEEKVKIIKNKLKNLNIKLNNKLDSIKIENQNVKENLNNKIITKILNNQIENEEDIYKAINYLIKNTNTIIERYEKSEKLIKINSLIKEKDKLEKPQKEQPQDSITIGTSAALSQSFGKAIGISLKDGLSLYISEINKSGGFHDRFIKSVFLDDKYLPYLFSKNIKELYYYYKTDLILIPEGSMNIFHAMDFIKENNIYLLFAKSGASYLRDSNLKNIVNYRASYYDEARALIDYIIHYQSAKNILLFYQDDDFGKSALEGARYELKKNNINNYIEVPYNPTESNFYNEIKKIKESKIDALGFFALGPSVIKLIRGLDIEYIANKILFAISSVSDNLTMSILNNMGLNLLTSQVVPDPENSNLEIVKEYRAKLAKYNYKPDYFSLESYIAISIFFDQLEKIYKKDNNSEITGEKIIKEIENIKDYNFKGLKLNFDPKTRTLSKKIWLKTQNNNYIEKIID